MNTTLLVLGFSTAIVLSIIAIYTMVSWATSVEGNGE